MLCSLLLAAVLVGTSGPAATSPAAPQPYTVIAQGLVELTDGTYAWSHTAARDLLRPRWRSSLAGRRSSWREATVPSCSTGSDGSRALLADGEAVLGADAADDMDRHRSRRVWRRRRSHHPARCDRRHRRRSERRWRSLPAPGGTTSSCATSTWPPAPSLQATARQPAFAMVGAGTVADAAGTTIEAGGTVHVGECRRHADERRRATGHGRRWR